MPLNTVVHPHSAVGLDAVGLTDVEKYTRVHWNLTPPEIYEYMIKTGEGYLTDKGAIRVRTGQYTGRSPKDKFFVEQESSRDKIWDGNSFNQFCSQELFDHMKGRVIEHLSHAQDLFVIDAFVGADPKYRLPVRVISEKPYHALFSWNMLVRATEEEQKVHQPEFTVMAAPGLIAVPEQDGTKTGTFIGVDIDASQIIIVGSMYSGEVKKGLFGIMNYMLPEKGVFPMHCSANVGADGKSAIFFGLSGTGKTTLSADASRTLIGDDEHGWSDDGIFNFEGGCYAKTIKLNPETEPEIYNATQMYGTILENVLLAHDTREPDFDSDRYTQNTRAAYPLFYIPNASDTGMAGHPKNVVFLTADAFGVLPPLSKLSPEQAMYHFISGYTAKVAGTERGVTEPQATFSACFGAPFMPLHPAVYAEMLAEKMKEHGASAWLVNTGWTGGVYGVGSRMKLPYTRRMVNAALSGELDNVEFEEEPFFGLMIPTSAPDVPDEILNPRNTWSDKAAYDGKAKELADMFRENFKVFEEGSSEAILSGGPKV